MTADAPASDLKHTPLHALHVELGARLVPFAGYEMPVQYPAGVLKEHRHTRTDAGLFDVSHMGQIAVRASRPGADAFATVARAFEALVPVDVLGLAEGRQRYALFTADDGGILDDLMVVRLDDALHVVVNAACRHDDLARMTAALQPAGCTVQALDDAALLALQGPRAAEVLGALNPAATALVFMQIARMQLAGIDCIVSRSGYTGEDGYEISVPAAHATALARALLAHEAVLPVGLGARDSLRLEAGLCLYGHDIDATTTPVEAGLAWALSKARRADGARPGGYPGADVVLAQLRDGAGRRRVGLRGLDRMPVREGADLLDRDAGDARVIGRVTSGTPGPSAGGPVAMGYVETAFAATGTTVHAHVRGRRLPMQIVPMPFVAHRYFRG